jgi:hypothetical protein
MSVKFIKTGAQNQSVLNAKSLPSLQCCMSKNRELLDGAIQVEREHMVVLLDSPTT